MKATLKRNLMILVGTLITLILLWALLRNIDFSQLGEALGNANYYWLIPNVVLIVVTMYLRAFRWHHMVAPVYNVPMSNLMAATCIGFMANNILPLRLGEFVRAYSLSAQSKQVSKSASLANILVERMVFDLPALLLILGVVMWAFPGFQGKFDQKMITGIYLAIAIALVAMLAMLVLAHKPEGVGIRLARYLFFLPKKWHEKIKNIIMKFSQGLAFLTDLRQAAGVGFYTIAIWLVMGISGYFVFLAFDLDLPIDAAYVTLVVVSIAILIPSSPGFIAVYHFGAVYALTAYGIGREEALSCAIVLHATQYIVITLMGFYYLKKEHLSLKQLERAATDELD